MAHAQLELNINCAPLIALKVLNTARISFPTAACDVRFVCMLCKVLTLLGDLKQIRWIFQSIIAEPAVLTPYVPLVAGAPNVITSGLGEMASVFADKGNKGSLKPNMGTGNICNHQC